MKVILLGAPASGKGTQTKLLLSKLNVPHVSTGNILRENIANGTELGLKAKEYMDQGLLVPDELILGIAEERLSRDDCKAGFVLDGFPRTIHQAKALDEILEKFGVHLDAVVDIEVAESFLYNRITGRRACPLCGETYHITDLMPKVDGKCDKCGADLITRADDTREVFGKRLEEYKNLTAPLIDFYKEKGLLKTVVSNNIVEDVHNEILKVLGI